MDLVTVFEDDIFWDYARRRTLLVNSWQFDFRVVGHLHAIVSYFIWGTRGWTQVVNSHVTGLTDPRGLVLLSVEVGARGDILFGMNGVTLTYRPVMSAGRDVGCP